MGIYQGLQFFKRNNGCLDLFPLDDCDGELNYCCDDIFIHINSDNSLEDKVKTFIHELIHLVPENWMYWCYLMDNYIDDKLVDEFEESVENETQMVYESQPILINYLREKIQNVKDREIVQLF